MVINLTEFYKGLEAWRSSRHISVESQKAGYIVNVMEELGELSSAIRDYEKIKNGELVCKDNTKAVLSLTEGIIAEPNIEEITLKKAEHAIIDALCDIAVFTINAGADMPSDFKATQIQPNAIYSLNAELNFLIERITHFNRAIIFGVFPKDTAIYFNSVLDKCADICQQQGYNFEIAMLETIKEISSRTGFYDENAKKWVKDTSPEAKSKWYKADYERAKIK